ncbi:hypothetical protein SAMN05421734_102414 [Pelagirhabdus alkalitolerans]|uniref:Uncharacterized protein n=1 Tax=Pelagirhabdus alkalitolerans TaxID=1612202 RepID=A0A1G6HA74_9BACI|nr:hypothetical protein [Pelagirhabdus alkalitolerans]SDB91199.1 hypothetical protein SAMN05421734_102414 [Pelagirhabdus alkalitolerans]
MKMIVYGLRLVVYLIHFMSISLWMTHPFTLIALLVGSGLSYVLITSYKRRRKEMICLKDYNSAIDRKL